MSYYKEESAVLLFLARWGQASTPELPHGATPKEEETEPLPSMLNVGYIVRAQGPCPRTGGHRDVWMLTPDGLAAAKKRGHALPKLRIDQGKLAHCYYVARNARGNFMFFGQVRSHLAGGMCALDVYEVGYLERPPRGRVWRVEDMHGWELHIDGAQAHQAALRAVASGLFQQAVRDSLLIA